jgi:pullulanase/glycogen debranching enzyme
MLLAGDELGRTQGGNNNAYCQDNETSWVDWANGRASWIPMSPMACSPTASSRAATPTPSRAARWLS